MFGIHMRNPEKNPDHYGKIPWIRAVLIMLSPIICLFLCQLITLQQPLEALAWIFSHGKPAVLTYLTLLLALLLIERLSSSLFLAVLLSLLPCFLLSLASYIKQVINGVPLLISDLSMMGQVSEITGFVSDDFRLGGGTWLAMLLLLILCVFAFRFSRPLKKSPVWKRLTISAVLAAAIFCLINAPATAALLAGDDEGESQAMRNERLGLLAGLFSAARQSFIQEPDAYSEDNMNRILKLINKGSSTLESPQQPNVIVLMSESFFDPDCLPNVQYSTDPVSNYRALAKDFPSGIFLSNTFAGGTGNVEMEVFTGIPSALIGTGETLSSLRSSDIYSRLPSIVRTFGANGYETSFIHSYNNLLFERENNIPAIGFNTVLFQEDFTVEPSLAGGYYSDDTLISQLIAQFESKGDKPIFLYSVSMENHQPFEADKFETPSPITAQSDLLGEDGLGVMNSLLHGLYDADAALGRLTEYLSALEEPTILLFFGDHLPGLSLGSDDSVYARLGYTSTADTTLWTPHELKQMHSTPFLLWNNYDAQFEVPELMGGMGFGSYLLDWAGISKPLYFTWVDNALEQMLLYRERLFVKADGTPFNAPPSDCDDMINTYKTIIYDIVYGKQYTAEAFVRLP